MRADRVGVGSTPLVLGRRCLMRGMVVSALYSVSFPAAGADPRHWVAQVRGGRGECPARVAEVIKGA